MERNVKIYWDSVLQDYVITEKKLPRGRFYWCGSFATVPAAESRVEHAKAANGDFGTGYLDAALAKKSGFALSGDDMAVYCVAL